jgi:eukaryotic-like serine/threonine-protein kinase
VVAALAALAAVGVLGVLGQFGPHRTATLPAGTPTPKAAAMTVEVSARSLVGRPVPEVVARLGRLGLKVRVRWEVTGQQRPGRVVSVQPGGALAPGSVVTVTGALHSAGHAPGRSARPPAGPPAPASQAPGTSAPATSAPPAQPTPSGSGSPGTSGPPGATDSPAPPAPTDGPAPPGTPPATTAPGVLAPG